jgi:hypothetical protein
MHRNQAILYAVLLLITCYHHQIIMNNSSSSSNSSSSNVATFGTVIEMIDHVATSAKELEHMIGNPTELALALLQTDDTQRCDTV